MNAPSTTLALLLTATAAGCGYTFGAGLDDYDVRTVAFEVVGNESFRQRFEVEINRFLARELPVATNLVLADRQHADAVLQVTLESTRERTIVIGVPDRDNPGDLSYPRVREGALEGTVRVQLVARDGTVILRRRILDRTEFRAPLGENVTSARAEMAQDLARKIVLALENDF